MTRDKVLLKFLRELERMTFYKDGQKVCRYHYINAFRIAYLCQSIRASLGMKPIRYVVPMKVGLSPDGK